MTFKGKICEGIIAKKKSKMTSVSMTLKVPDSEKNFVINFGAEEFYVSKEKLVLFAPNFKDYTNEEKMSLPETVPVSAFTEFIKASQGEQYSLTPQNAEAIKTLAIKWNASSLFKEVNFLINPEGALVDSIGEYTSDENQTPEEIALFEESIAQHIDLAVKIDSFVNFPLPKLIRIFNNPKVLIKDHNAVHQFLMRMLVQYKAEASPLFKPIKLTNLTHEQILEILENKDLDKSYIGETASDLAVLLLRDYQGVKKHQTKLRKRIEKIEEYDFRTEFYKIDAAFEELNKRIENNLGPKSTKNQTGVEKLEKKLDERLKQYSDNIANLYTKLEGKMKAQQSKQNSNYRDALDSIKNIENSIYPIKTECAEMRRNIRSVIEKQKNMLANTDGSIESTDAIELPFQGIALDGILAYLTDLARANISTAGICVVTASSISHGKPEFAVARNPNDYFATSDRPGQWIMFDFGNNAVDIKNYTLKRPASKSIPILKKWIIEGSNTTDEFTRLDLRQSSSSGSYMTYPVASPSGPYRYIRLRMTDKNSQSKYQLVIQSVEFFGTLHERPKPQ